MSNSEPILRGSGLGMHFGGVPALRNVDIELHRHRTTGLIGPNGSGKSTLLNVLTGVYAHTSGTIELGGVDVSKHSARRRGAAGLARTFQHPQVASSLTIAENVEQARPRASRSGKGDLSVDQALEIFGCAAYAHRLPAEAPYGVVKLLEIARAVVRQPAVLFLDEPAAGSSAQERAELVDALRRYRDVSDTAIMLIEHDVEIVRALCPELVVLETGGLAATGPTEDVLRDPRVRSAYLGETIDNRTETQESI